MNTHIFLAPIFLQAKEAVNQAAEQVEQVKEQAEARMAARILKDDEDYDYEYEYED